MEPFSKTPARDLEDDQKLNFYFSPFRRDRSINPHSWDSKIKFWNDTIIEHSQANKRLTFNSKTLPEHLSQKSRVPQCLDVVINDMLKKGLVQKYSDYIYSCNSSWISWSFNYFVTKPIKWSFNKFVKGSLTWAYSWVSGSSEEDYNLNLFGRKHVQLPDEEYVVIDLVKQAARDIYARHNDSVMYDITDNVVDYNVLRQKCSDLCSDERSFEVAVLELCRQKLCSVKIGPEGEKLIMMITNKTSKSPMSGNEMKIHKLKVTQAKMEAEITKIEKQIDECISNAKMCLQQGKKSIALKHLKKKKGLEKILQQRDQAIEKIENLISIIQQTESQKHVIDAYSSGVQAFKGLREKAGLTEDKIDETMSDIQEAFEATEDINQTISRPITDLNDIDQDDLEKELEEILGIKEENKDDQKDTLDLPEVPSHDPRITPPRKERVPWNH